MTSSKIDFSITDGIARIVLAGPENHNTVDAVFACEFERAAIACENEPGLKVVLLSALGEVFSFGGDLRSFVENKERIRDYIREMAIRFHSAVAMLHRLPVPVVAAVNGTAAGGGFSLVCMADLAIAKRSARFNAAYTRSGLTPDGGMTYFLARLVGAQRAFDIMATNPTLSADEAQELGIIARVVDDEVFDDEVENLVGQLAATPSGAVGAMKTLLRSSFSNSLEEQLELEGKSIASNAALPETMDMLEAFLNRRRK